MTKHSFFLKTKNERVRYVVYQKGILWNYFLHRIKKTIKYNIKTAYVKCMQVSRKTQFYRSPGARLFLTTVTFLEDKLLVLLRMDGLHAQTRQIYLIFSGKLPIVSQTVEKNYKNGRLLLATNYLNNFTSWLISFLSCKNSKKSTNNTSKNKKTKNFP